LYGASPALSAAPARLVHIPLRSGRLRSRRSGHCQRLLQLSLSPGTGARRPPRSHVLLTAPARRPGSLCAPCLSPSLGYLERLVPRTRPPAALSNAMPSTRSVSPRRLAPRARNGAAGRRFGCQSRSRRLPFRKPSAFCCQYCDVRAVPLGAVYATDLPHAKTVRWWPFFSSAPLAHLACSLLRPRGGAPLLRFANGLCSLHLITLERLYSITEYVWVSPGPPASLRRPCALVLCILQLTDLHSANGITPLYGCMFNWSLRFIAGGLPGAHRRTCPPVVQLGHSLHFAGAKCDTSSMTCWAASGGAYLALHNFSAHTSFRASSLFSASQPRSPSSSIRRD